MIKGWKTKEKEESGWRKRRRTEVNGKRVSGWGRGEKKWKSGEGWGRGGERQELHVEVMVVTTWIKKFRDTQKWQITERPDSLVWYMLDLVNTGASITCKHRHRQRDKQKDTQIHTHTYRDAVQVKLFLPSHKNAYYHTQTQGKTEARAWQLFPFGWTLPYFTPGNLPSLVLSLQPFSFHHSPATRSISIIFTSFLDQWYFYKIWWL